MRNRVVYVDAAPGSYDCINCSFLWQGPEHFRHARRFSANAMRAHMAEHEQYGDIVTDETHHKIDSYEQYEQEGIR